MSAWSELSPKHRLFINNLIKCKLIQRDAYMMTYGQTDPVLADSSASHLMATPGMKEALLEKQQELAIKDIETLERVISRFSKEADAASRAADRIRANELLAKILGYMNDGQQIQINVMDTSDLDGIREKLRLKGFKGKSLAKEEMVIGSDIVRPGPSNSEIEASEPSVDTDGTSVQEDVKE